MIKINSEELKDLEKVGSGLFGAVYKVDDDTAYKVYHPTIKSYGGARIPNPAIPLIKRRIKRFQKRNKKLKITTLPDDYLVINGNVGGIRIPYYDGITLTNLSDSDYSLKKDVSYQLIDAHTELTDNCIYPVDYHLDNVILQDGNIKLIDLDDPLTHVLSLPNPIFRFTSRISLNENICKLFNAFNWPYTRDVKLKLQRERISDTSKKEFPETFFEERERITSYLVIDINSNIDLIKKYISSRDCRIIFLINRKEMTEEDIMDLIDIYNQQGIEIFDMVDYSEIDNYLTNYKVDREVELSEKNLYIKK